jgi:hypothetical protein
MSQYPSNLHDHRVGVAWAGAIGQSVGGRDKRGGDVVQGFASLTPKRGGPHGRSPTLVLRVDGVREKILLFSSDYPHWTFDDPRWLVKHLPEHAREAIMFRDGMPTYTNVPDTVPALEGQVRVF